MDNSLRDSSLFEEKFKWKEQRENRNFFFVVALVFILLFTVVFAWRSNFGGVEVDGQSMYQTLLSGDKLLMRYTSDTLKAKRGDVIVVDVRDYEEFRGSGTQFLIKRLIATEGDKIKCLDGQISIQYAETPERGFEPLSEDYAYYDGNGLTAADYDFEEYEVGEGEIFFLGDNRNNSRDSRYKEGGSRLLDRLYKEDDIYGIVPDWAIEHKSILEKIFFAWQ